MPKDEKVNQCMMGPRKCGRPGLPFGVFIAQTDGVKYMTPCAIHICEAISWLAKMKMIADGGGMTAETASASIAEVPPEEPGETPQ